MSIHCFRSESVGEVSRMDAEQLAEWLNLGFMRLVVNVTTPDRPIVSLHTHTGFTDERFSPEHLSSVFFFLYWSLSQAWLVGR